MVLFERAKRAADAPMAAKFDQAKFDKQVMGMHPLYRGFVFYAKYHWDAV